MELINTIILLLSTALPLIAAIITVIAKYIKSDKAKKIAQDLLKINDVIEEYMVKAEKFKGYTGLEKKNYVLRCVKNYALSEEMELDESKTGEMIEKLIEFSKGVNKEEGGIEAELTAETKKMKASKKSANKKSSKTNKSDLLENTKQKNKEINKNERDN